MDTERIVEVVAFEDDGTERVLVRYWAGYADDDVALAEACGSAWEAGLIDRWMRQGVDYDARFATTE